MNGRFPLDFFTLGPVGAAPAQAGFGAVWKRLYAALTISCLLHAALVFMPALGASSALYRFAVRGAQKPGPARVIEVRLAQAGGFAASIAEGSAAQAGAAAAPARPAVSEEPRPALNLSRGIDLLPVPAPTYYTADQLTKRPWPISEPRLDVPPGIARSVSGRVILKLWIDELGNVDSVEVEESNLPKTISGAAAADFGKLRFQPGEIEGRRVAALMRIEVSYRGGKVRSPW